jgi:WD40 repeat protein
MQWHEDSSLQALTADAKQFLIRTRQIVEEAPLQIYSSAIALAPGKSEIRRLFLDQLPRWLCQLPVARDDWSPELRVIHIESSLITAVAFSPDSQILAVAGSDKVIRLLKVKTGSICAVLKGQF